MEIIIENITWNFKGYSQWDELDAILGTAYVGIPPNMLKRFIKECGWNDDAKVPPHYDPYDAEYLRYDEIHDCYNSDTQIVLMNWLHDKRRKYQLEYRGDDPFWIFHDHCHSQNDVYSYEVSGIRSYVEYTRILEGADMAKDHGIFIQPKTVAGILDAWTPRFKWDEGSGVHPISEKDFYPLMEDDHAADQIHLYYG